MLLQATMRDHGGTCTLEAFILALEQGAFAEVWTMREITAQSMLARMRDTGRVPVLECELWRPLDEEEASW